MKKEKTVNILDKIDLKKLALEIKKETPNKKQLLKKCKAFKLASLTSWQETYSINNCSTSENLRVDFDNDGKFISFSYIA